MTINWQNKIRLARFYCPEVLKIGQEISLNPDASFHANRVLRLKVGDKLITFDGAGGEYLSQIIAQNNKSMNILTIEKKINKAESPLNTVLAPAISRGDKMDLVVQKGVELGVKKIVPIFTKRSTIKLDKSRKEKRVIHWRKIAIASSEQCGRALVPEVCVPTSLSKWITSIDHEYQKSVLKVVLSPHTKKTINTLSRHQNIVIIVGPESGLTEVEIHLLEEHGFVAVRLGPRVLRTETAGIAALTAMQSMWGDL